MGIEIKSREGEGTFIALREGPWEDTLMCWEQHMAGIELGGQNAGQLWICCVMLDWPHPLSGAQFLLV